MIEIGIAPKNSHARSRPSQTASVVCRNVGQTKPVAAERERDDERPERASSSRLGVEEHAHLAEVDLRLLARRRIVDTNCGWLLAPSEHLHREATKRPVARGELVIAHEQ